MLRSLFRHILLVSAPVGTVCCGGSTAAVGGNADAAPSCDPPRYISSALNGSCQAFDITLPCELSQPGVQPVTPEQCAKYCTPFAEAGSISYCLKFPGTEDGGADGYLQCQSGPCMTGRRPEGLASLRDSDGNALGRFLARAAHLEDASVHAFRVLRDELRAHRAPAKLVRLAERSARDEARHTRIMTRLARRFGVEPARARVERRPLRPLAEVALENAVEGCVRETFGALLAWRQARTAGDVELARAMRAIAADETRHAALSWAVHRWSCSRLTADETARLRAATAAALAEFEADVAKAEPHPTLRRTAGLPSAAEAGVLVRKLRASVLFAST